VSKARGIVVQHPRRAWRNPVFKGTRIPVHDIADMLANGDHPSWIKKAFPRLDADKIRLAAIYALAYPRRGSPADQSAPVAPSKTFGDPGFRRRHQP